MCCVITILSLALAADSPALKDEAATTQTPRLELVANSTTILQRDPLFLMSLVHNSGSTDIRLFHEPYETGEYTVLYLRTKEEWRRISTMAEIRDPRRECDGVQIGCAVLSRSSFAEYHALLRNGEAFIFEEPGKYELRAVVRMADRLLTSKPVTITVEPRPVKDLERIGAAGKQLHSLEFLTLKWKLPAQMKALADVGGNTGTAIRNALLLEEFAKGGAIDGQKIAKSEIINILKERFDRVSKNKALDQLAEHFRLMGDGQTFRSIVAETSFDSRRRRESLREFRLLTDPTAAESWTRRDFGQPSDEKVDSN